MALFGSIGKIVGTVFPIVKVSEAALKATLGSPKGAASTLKEAVSGNPLIRTALALKSTGAKPQQVQVQPVEYQVAQGYGAYQGSAFTQGDYFSQDISYGGSDSWLYPSTSTRSRPSTSIWED